MMAASLALHIRITVVCVLCNVPIEEDQHVTQFKTHINSSLCICNQNEFFWTGKNLCM